LAASGRPFHFWSKQVSKHTHSAYRQGYLDLWARAKVENVSQARRAAERILAQAEIYNKLARMTGVPWFAIGVIHMREANCDLRCCLHNGQRIIGTGQRTTIVPVGRGPFATFEEAAIDALKDYRGATWDVPQIAFTLESFNGFGYRGHGIPSPYLWGGSSVQRRGKYVRDGVFDPNVMDSQLGAMTVLRQLCMMVAEVAERIDGKAVPAPSPTAVPTPPDIRPVLPETVSQGAWAARISSILSLFKRT
jgi:lysozyme family protein